MSWKLRGDGQEVRPPGGADATVWEWALVSEEGSLEKKVQVWVSGTAMSSSTVPQVVAYARESKGQTAVSRFLNWDEPPNLIKLHTESEKPIIEGGEPGAEVRELNEIADWFDDRGIVIVFTGRSVGSGPNPSSWTHSANLINLEADEVLKRFEAESRLEAVRAAKTWWQEQNERDDKHKNPPEVAVAETPSTEPRRRLKEHGVHITLGRTSEADDAYWMAEAYDENGNFLGIAVQPTFDDVWLTIADDIVPPG